MGLRIGILGAGAIARDHAAAVHALGHRVVAGSTRSPNSPRWQSFRSVAPDARYVADGAALLDDPALDAVIVCLPWDVLPVWLPRLLAIPRPVLIEKPIGLDRAGLAAALTGPSLRTEGKMVGFNRRFYEPVGRLRERLGAGGLKAAEITISEDVARLVGRYRPEIVPHIPAYSSAHLLDLALHLLGPLAPVHMTAIAESGPAAPFRSYNGLLLTEAGVPVWLCLNAHDPVAVGIRCRFADHTVWHLSPVERLTVYCGYEVKDPEPGRNIRRYLPAAVETVDADLTLKPGFLAQMAAFLSGDFGPAARPVDSLALLALIEEIGVRAVVPEGLA